MGSLFALLSALAYSVMYFLIRAGVRRGDLDGGAFVTTAVNVILPERLHANLPRLRGRRALAVKRCLLFEPHVILTSVPTPAGPHQPSET